MKQLLYSNAEASVLANHFFQMQLPTTPDEFKHFFRKACKRLHTDVSGKDTHDDFIRMKSFYENLCLQNPDWLFAGSRQSKTLKTNQGIPLSELGLGLEPNKNGRDCEGCNHKGYTEHQLSGWKSCPDCLMGYSYNQTCSNCRGTGKFGIKGKGLVTCSVCKGEGKNVSYFPQICRRCKGVGGQVIAKPEIEYLMCCTCKGTGEIEIHNPVIPKGRLI